MPALANSRHEAFAQALARGLSISTAYVEAGYKPNRGNAHTLLKQNKCISKRVDEIQAEQLAIHHQATANAKVTLESLIAEAEAARVKAMSEKGGSVWREKVEQHNTGAVSTVWSVSWDEEGEQSDGQEAG
jgi:hypothetical protein